MLLKHFERQSSLIMKRAIYFNIVIQKSLLQIMDKAMWLEKIIENTINEMVPIIDSSIFIDQNLAQT